MATIQNRNTSLSLVCFVYITFEKTLIKHEKIYYRSTKREVNWRWIYALNLKTLTSHVLHTIEFFCYSRVNRIPNQEENPFVRINCPFSDLHLLSCIFCWKTSTYTKLETKRERIKSGLLIFTPTAKLWLHWTGYLFTWIGFFRV